MFAACMALRLDNIIKRDLSGGTRRKSRMLEEVARERQVVVKLRAIYDGVCRACTGFAKVAGLLDTRHRLRLIPAQSWEAQALFPLEELRRTFHVILPDGSALVHGEALVTVVGSFPGLWWLPWMVHRSRRARRFTNRLYGWLARNRHWIGYFA